MSDDLVKRLRTSWDADRSIISQTDNWMRERQEAADRIEELEAKLNWVIVERDETFALMLDRAQTAEAKLVKALEALERIEEASRYFGNDPEASETTVRYAHETTRRLCSATLAELKGEE
jgi:hypothetical protein